MPTPTNTSNDFLDYNLPQNAYAAFDAVSLKSYIVDRLNKNEKFTDQNFDASNLAAIIDIIAYSYHVLLFYLNNTATEVNFDQASLYENMNRIVKLIGYKPAGKQTSLVPIECTGSVNLPINNYTIRKYSYFLVDNIQYTFLNDVSFSKTVAGSENITSINDSVVLYQGSVAEYPSYTAQGEIFEVLPIVVDNIVNSDDAKFIADNTISVNVLETDSGLYHEYREVDNLFLSTSNERVFEKRLNENGHYEIKFGDGIFGKRLGEGDTVAVSYILSDNKRGVINKNALAGKKLFVYESSRQRAIFNDTYLNKDQTTFITANNSSELTFNNPLDSSSLTDEETVQQIRENAPKVFSSQLRLVTESDYEALIHKNLSHVVGSAKVVGNDTYMNEYIQYFYNIGVNPNKVNRVLINQVNFASSCDFNNINIFVAPKFVINEDRSYPPYVSNSFKNLILELTEDKKMISNEVVPRDPVYMAYGLGVNSNTDRGLKLSILDNTQLCIVRKNTNKINKNTIKAQVVDIIRTFFDPNNNELGQNISLTNLTNTILSIEGVERIYTHNTTDNTSYDGISFLSFNPLYPDSDMQIVTQDDTLPFFKFPYLYAPLSISNRIAIKDE
tara:strand:+ start:690 stop:2534 length:1845 start_codon:yes stop_codon:yes gene_type:complete